MKKEIYFSPIFNEVDIENISKEIFESREKNQKIIKEITKLMVQDGKFDYGDLQTGDELNYELWKSKELPEFSKAKLGSPSSLEFTEEELYDPKNESSTVFHNIYIFYFDDGPDAEGGETTGCDGYKFYGVEREEVKRCAKNVADFWQLTEYEKKF